MTTSDAYDIAIIGAGVNGAGIARDAALRGLRVAIFDRDDCCSGTSAYSSRLIHGGLRYLEYGEIPLVYESLRERIALRAIAPHLVQPLRIAIPIYEQARRGKWLVRLGMIAYDLLSMGKTVPGHDMLSSVAAADYAPGLEADGLTSVARYFDAQVTFAERLVVENLIAARMAGADVYTHTDITKLVIDSERVTGLEGRSVLDDSTVAINAKVVINAAGPWVDKVFGQATDVETEFIGGTKGSHIVVSGFEGAPSDAFYVEAESDGRPFFIIPWNNQYLIGTTDIRYQGEIAELRASAEEVDYLLNETNRVFPQAKLSANDVNFAYAGVRPLPRRKKGPESAITRKHIIETNTDIAGGLITIIGGKLTTYRNLAEQAVDRAGRLLSKRLPDSRTREIGLPGSHRMDEARTALAQFPSLSSRGAERLLGIYGGRLIELLAFADEQGFDKEPIDDDRSVLAAEVAFAIRAEMAKTLIDIVYRRTMIGLSADQGRSLYASFASLAATELDWSEQQRQLEMDALQRYSDSFSKVS
ncbi:MAG: glycerol-3-phosphate dehydrogenase [Pseudomonadota bacterium]